MKCFARIYCWLFGHRYRWVQVAAMPWCKQHRLCVAQPTRCARCGHESIEHVRWD